MVIVRVRENGWIMDRSRRKPVGFADGMDVGCESKSRVEDEAKVIGLAIKDGVSILHLQGWEKRVGGKCMWQEDEMFWTFQVPYRHPSGAVSR